ncbi:MAG: helix-turn-helix domain-containing protein, partial [bacterium]
MENFLASNIRYLRKKENMSQEEFAERFGVSRQSVAKWESGESAPDVFKCSEIAEAYDVSLDVLLNLSLEGGNYLVESKDGKYIFGLVRVGSRGQVVIPKYARDVFGI